MAAIAGMPGTKPQNLGSPVPATNAVDDYDAFLASAPAPAAPPEAVDDF